MTVDLSLRQCGECGVLVPEPQGSGPVSCTNCGATVLASLFPALWHQRPRGAGEALTSQEEASCFFHVDKRAAAACDSCGRFVCSLCSLAWGSRTMCPSCVANAERNTTLLVKQRTLYDSIALATATFSAFLLQLSIFTLPAAIYLAVRSLRTPGSLVRKNRTRSWIAIVIATAQLVAWTWLIVYLVLSMPK